MAGLWCLPGVLNGPSRWSSLGFRCLLFMNTSSYIVQVFLVVSVMLSGVFLGPMMSNTAGVFARTSCFLMWHFWGVLCFPPFGTSEVCVSIEALVGEVCALKSQHVPWLHREGLYVT